MLLFFLDEKHASYNDKEHETAQYLQNTVYRYYVATEEPRIDDIGENAN
jgi:hypothetical protein